MKKEKYYFVLARKVWNFIPKEYRTVISRPVHNIKYKIAVDRYLRNYNLNAPPLFQAIELETVNRCNGKCTFCPVNVNEKQRKYAKMSRELFEKIISELKDIGYSGKIALFSNNEPFLDERIIEWNRIVRGALPEASVYLYTNGSLLNVEKVKEIMKYLDKLIIDNYDEECLDKNLFEIAMWKQRDVAGKKVVIVPRKRSEVLTSRGGQAPNKKKADKVSAKCFLPYQQLVVRPDGKVSLCCNDALGIYTMGNLNKQSLLEIWNSEKYKIVRKKMKEYGRSKLRLCNNCDTRNYTNWEL